MISLSSLNSFSEVLYLCLPQDLIHYPSFRTGYTKLKVRDSFKPSVLWFCTSGST